MTEEYRLPEWQQKNLEAYLDIAFKHEKLDRHKVQFIRRFCDNPERLIKISFNKKRIYKMMPQGKYYEYKVKRAALDDRFLKDESYSAHDYKKDSLELDLKYENYITPKGD